LEIDDANFTQLLNFTGVRNYNELTWANVQALQSLSRVMFPEELYWRQDPDCHGFYASENENCAKRTGEM